MNLPVTRLSHTKPLGDERLCMPARMRKEKGLSLNLRRDTTWKPPPRLASGEVRREAVHSCKGPDVFHPARPIQPRSSSLIAFA